MAKVVLRREAVQLGLSRYFTGRPCIRGHVSERVTESGECCECQPLKYHKYRTKNREKRNKQTREWFKNNPDYRRIRRSGDGRKYYGEDGQKCIARTQRFRRANLEKYALYKRNRNARLRGAGGTHTLADIDEIRIKQRNMCAICAAMFSKIVKMHVDHMQPIAKGGSNDRRNIQLLCEECNVRKSDRDPEVFMRIMGKLV